MKGLLNYDGPLMRAITLISDMVILNLLWIITSLPIITIGASTTAAYYACTKRINGKESYIWKDFFKSFRQNFKQATVVWLVWNAAIGLLMFGVEHGIYGDFANIVYPIIFFMFIELGFFIAYVFPIMSRFNVGYRQLIKNTLYMAHRHLLTTLGLAFSLAFVAATIFTFEIGQAVLVVLFLGISFYIYLSSLLFLNVFKKYAPELDSDENTH